MDKEIKLSNFNQTLLWFGAAISLAEILAGTLIAPIGFQKGLIAIIIGHLFGAIIFFLVGYIGAKEKITALQSISFTFGKFGVNLFSLLNVIQLIGWSAIMIKTGALALTMSNQAIPISIFSIIIGLFIFIFIIVGFKNLNYINYFAIIALLILSIILAFIIFNNNLNTSTLNQTTIEKLSFGSAIELSITMPLSWTPLISDYTKNNKNVFSGTFSATISYFIGSSFMFIIGIGSAIYCGNQDIITILLSAGLGIFAIIIALLSTITTAFLDVYSGGISIINIFNKINDKIAASIILVIGILLAVFVSMEQYESFLYFIGSVFAPLFAILLVDYYIYHKFNNNKTDIGALIIWLIGFITYRILLNYQTPIGITLPIMIGSAILFVIYKEIKKYV
ncbi:MAG: putative hydroxymethylpyrimidine transporter CytX [Bacilli bacterium]|jgi:putative hydroxymethylpyrimidine transporter CytX|nr:putative hydroxymethylpyrimidine transporter CytX [Bacilli bacterium]